MEDSNKRSYFLGLLTGCIIAAFILCLVLIVKVITGGPVGGGDSRGNLKVTPTGSESSGSGSGTAESKPPVEDDGYVLDDPKVTRKIEYLEDLIDKEFIDSVSNDSIANGIYSGIMGSLNDPYAVYYTPEEWIAMQQSTQGIYYGIGAYLTKDTETLYPRISGIIKNTPAEEAGLMENDYIVEVAGEDVFDWKLDDVVSKIKGEEGTTVDMTIIRGEGTDREELDFTVERRKVETPTVEYEKKENGIAYIQISEFDAVTVDQFAEALAEAKADNMKSLIIDLRSNPGGSLKAVVDIAGMLLPAGRVVYTEDKYGKQIEYTCDGKHELNVPMVVLVNGNSASASEILAGAIKDYKKGTLMGTTTFGKGIVQQLFTMTDGSAVKLTVSHYYTPNGNDIHKVGIEPDVEIKFDSEAYKADKTDNQLDAAIEYLSK